MGRTKVVFRADGNSQIGLGHVVRSLALAEMLKADFECVFAIQEPGALLEEEINKTCDKLIKLPANAAKGDKLAEELNGHITGKEILVLDGYKFDTQYQQHIKRSGCGIVCIDDIHAYHFIADIIINHAGGILGDKYSKEPYTRCFLGPAYALLRSPFLGTKKNVSQSRSTERLFINMGGADPDNQTCKLLNQVKDNKHFKEIHVVIGPAYRFAEELNDLIKSKEVKHVFLHKNLAAAEMAALMGKCGIAVCPPSSVCYEYASMGGLLFLKQIAENQREVRAYFLDNFLALDFDQDFERVMNDKPEDMAEKVIEAQRKILDGKSDERLREIFKRFDLVFSLTLRPACLEDMLIIYEWANDADTRRFSFNTQPISLEGHQKWFAAKLKERSANFYLAEYKGKPVGQIRFDGKEEKLISYQVAPEMRGYGLGYHLLMKGMERLLEEEKEVVKISGYVKKSNVASCKIFDKAGFLADGQTAMPYPDALKYELTKNNFPAGENNK